MSENKHTKAELMQWQALPLSTKILMSQERIRNWAKAFDNKVYVSFSGGKDSTVLKHLVETTIGQVYNAETDEMEYIPSLFVNTGLEYPEIQRFAMSQPNVITVRPKMRFDEVIKKYGYPVVSKEVSQIISEARQTKANGRADSWALKKIEGRKIDKFSGEKSRFNVDRYKYLYDSDIPISGKCCQIMKKSPASTYEKTSGRKAFIGTMAEESKLRENTWVKYGCNAYDKKGRQTSTPLSFWTDQDILQYLVVKNLQYASVYGDIVAVDKDGFQYDAKTIYQMGMNLEDYKLTTSGAKRTGCMFCMFGMRQDGHPNRFERMKTTHPIQYQYCMKDVEEGGLGLDKVLTFMKIEH